MRYEKNYQLVTKVPNFIFTYKKIKIYKLFRLKKIPNLFHYNKLNK